MKGMAAGTLVVMLALGAPVGFAATIDAQAEVAAVLYAASATQAAVSKSLDDRLKSQQDRINALAAELKSGDTRHRAEMTAAQESFVADLAAKDREYAAQIGLFRSTVNDIASTPDGVYALERFNAGDEIAALAILDRLRAANERMRELRAKLEDAAEGRRIARLALEAKNRGKLPAQAVIARYEEVVRLDSGVVADWRELERLYQEVGRLADAKRAVDALATAAHDDPDRALAFSERSDVLLAQGDLAGSRRAAEQALSISRRLLAASPQNPDIQFTFSQSLISFGQVARRQADLPAAHRSYVEEIAFTRHRLEGDAEDPKIRQTLAADLLHLADVLIQQGDISGARTALEENLRIFRRLAVESPENIVIQRRTAVSLMWLSDILVGHGEFAEARKANADIVATASKLTAADPVNATLQRDLAFGYIKTALVQRIEGDFDGALDYYQRALVIFRELGRNPSAGLDVRQDVGTGLVDVGSLKYLKGDLDGAVSAEQEGLGILRLLAAADATDATSRQFLAAGLYGVGAALTADVRYGEARKAFDEGLAVDRALATQSADAAEIQDDISTGLLGLGKLQIAQGNRTAGLKSAQQSLLIRRRRSALHPGSSSAERGVAEVMRVLVDLPGSNVAWTDFRAQVEGMQRAGIFWPADQSWLEDARRNSPTGAAP